MSEEKSSYRQIFKATSIFGGVQVINIIISIIRSKFVAIFLGPSGMGVVGLFLSATSLISGFTTFGIGTSAIRDISKANEEGNLSVVSRVVKVFRRLVWITGLLGFIITLIFAKQLSLMTFGTDEYTLGFRWISISLLFNQLTSGQNVLLQGMRHIKSLALANVLGSLGSLVISLPLYYFYRLDGIVPAIIIGSALAMIIEYYFSSRIKLEKVNITTTETIVIAKSMLILGVMLTISGIITVLSSYLIRIFIGKIGSMEDVGYYTAGFNIIASYVGLVFTAMSTDYFPRLSAVIHNQIKVNETVNHQADLSVLILGPILVGFIIYINWIIVVLYDSRFMSINQMIQWAALGIFFKAGSWAISFIFIAKGSNKIYFVNELLMNIYLTVFSYILYNWIGLKGLGIAFLVSYILYFIQGYIIANHFFKFNFNSSFFKVLIVQFALASISISVSLNLENFWSYILGSFLFVLSLYFTFSQINNRIGILDIIKERFKKNYEK